MSLIVHRCVKCTHPDYFHRPQECSFGLCRCDAKLDPEPEVIPTYLSGTHKLVIEIVRPGSPVVGFGTMGLVKTCGCERCEALYAQSGGVMQ